MNSFLLKKIDNTGLILFRMFFGILISLECYGAILTGWVKSNLVAPKFNFSFIGFEWLTTIAGPGMYVYFIVMGSLGILISIGYKYTYSMLAFALMWSGVYLMQKTSYNNHYYLLMLISSIMVFFPAHKDYSIDAKLNPEIRTNKMHAYFKYIIILQLFIVYTYAAIAKVYADWLNFEYIQVLMQGKANYFLIGDLLQLPWVHQIIAIFGILFDLLIIPALLWKPSRKYAFIFAVFFHLANSIIFQIGIFPYLALAFTVFFFDPKKIRALFFKNTLAYTPAKIITPKFKTLILGIWMLYFIFQIGLPLRHHFFKDDVLWTEEGHRLSWRMMLRKRSGTVHFNIVDKQTNTTTRVNLTHYLTKKQIRKIGAYPDFIWQFAQHLKKEAKKNNKEIAVFANARVSINGKPKQQLIDPKVDLAQEKWHHFKHNAFILPSSK